MNSCDRLSPTFGFMERCKVRLQNDAAALEKVGLVSDRLQITVHRFGNRVLEIELCFPQIRTAFLHTATDEVVVREARVLAGILPNAGNTFPYPLGAPEVGIRFLGLDDSAYVPWLGGLLWLSEHTVSNRIHQALQPRIAEMIRSMLVSRKLRVGIPCLWRDGEWDMDCDLIFVAGQIHQLLTDPRDYSPTDAMNEQAALYWARHRERLPLEPPIRELRRRVGVASENHPKTRFTLKEVTGR
jgi:hypothetical protein